MSFKSDIFFSKTNCDRCGSSLNIRKMSWFTEETLCMDCIKQEEVIKSQLRKAGKDVAAYEGCGYIPTKLE